MSAKDSKSVQNANDEKAFLNRVVSVTLRDRMESEFTDVRLTGLSEHSIILDWESRGTYHQTIIPRGNISFISAKYSNSGAAVSPPETKAV